MLASNFDWFYLLSVSFMMNQSAFAFGFTILNSKLPLGKFYLFLYLFFNLHLYFATSKLQSNTEQKLINMKLTLLSLLYE